MKLRIERDRLADVVAWAARTLPTRPTVPVLSGVLLHAENDIVTLTSSDQEVSSRAEVEASVGEPGDALVSGRLLADIAKLLPPQPVTLQLEGTRLSVKCGRASFALPTLPVEDYPPLDTMPPVAGTVHGSVLSDAVGQVAIAASRDDTLPVLTGVRVEFESSTITLAATDRYRLAVRSLPWQSASTRDLPAVLVRGRTLSDLSRPLAHVPDVSVALDDAGTLVGLSGGGRQSTTPLLEGEFPAYRQLLPTDPGTVVTMNTAELVDSVKRVKLVVERPNTPVKVTFSDGEAILSAGSGDDPSANETAEATIDGEGMDIAFNPEYLLDGLGAIGSERVRIALKQSTRPAVFSADDDTADYQYLLMPVRLAG